MELHQREHQVLLGISYGLNNRQIGDWLHLSEGTVKTYAKRLFDDLAVQTRSHAVRRGFEEGLLHVEQKLLRDALKRAGS